MAKSSFIEKTYVVGRPTHWNCLIEAIPMCTYNIRGNNLLIARVLQTRSMAPSLFTMLVFSFVKNILISVCQNYAMQAVPYITLVQNM